MRVCKECKKEIQVTPGSNKRYCSTRCRMRAYRRREQEKHGPRSRRRPVPVMRFGGVCLWCGEQLFASRRGHKQYCSAGCRQAAYRQRRAETVYVVISEEDSDA